MTADPTYGDLTLCRRSGLDYPCAAGKAQSTSPPPNMSSNYPPTSDVGRFFLPGPTAVHPDVLMAQAANVIGHRGGAIRPLITELQAGLKPLFGTQRPVFIAICSGTGMMEAAVRNGVSSRMLSLVNGAFSERFAKIGESCGFEVERLSVEWGQVLAPEEVRKHLESAAPYDAVTICHSETSTAALNPVAELSMAIHDRQPDAMVMVDSVSGVGGTPVETDAWKLDFVLTGAQKAVAVPPGLAFGVASERMMERSRSLEGKGFYFDLEKFETNIELMQTPTTPAVTLLYALKEQLVRIHREGLETRYARHRAMAERTWEWVDDLAVRTGAPFRVFAAEGHRSPTVTCLELPGGVDVPDLASAMKERGFVIGTGYGKLGTRAIRIGHMGEHTMSDLNALLSALEDALISAVSRVGV